MPRIRVPYVLGESENAAAGFTAEGVSGIGRIGADARAVWEGTAFPDAKLTIFGNADLFDVAPSVSGLSKNSNIRIFSVISRI